MKSSAKNKTKIKNKVAPVKKAIPVDVVMKAIPTDVVKKDKKNKITTKVVSHKKNYAKHFVRTLLLSKRFYLVCKILLGVVLLIFAFYGIYSYINTSFAHGVVVSQSEIIDRVAKLTTLPPGPPSSVVRVEDPETLKKQNIFLGNAKNGDYILMYEKAAIIYDLRNNSIVAVKKSE